MQIGYYWAKRGNTWKIVEVVKGLHGTVLEGGFSVKVGEYSEFVGPLTPPDDLAAKLAAAQSELHELRIKVGLQ